MKQVAQNTEAPLSEDQIIQLARKRFRCFLALVWSHLGLPMPTQTQIEIADYLQFGGKHITIHAMRGEGKSWITAAFVLWCLWNDPTINVMVVSASGSKALEFSTFSKRLIMEMPLLQHLRPRADQRDSVQAWDVNGAKISQAPSVKSVGITGQITGSRADLIVADDIETITNSLTADQREKLLHLVTEFVSVLKPHGRVAFLGTPQSIETIYRELAKRGYAPRYWPGRVPSPDKIDIYNGALAPSILEMIEQGVPAWTPTDPARFTDAVLREKEMQMGRSNFMLQFMLDTTLSDADRYPLKTSDLIVLPLNPEIAPVRLQWASIKECLLKDIPGIGFAGDRWYTACYRSPEWVRYDGCVMSIDSSGRGTDETTYAIVKELHGNLYVMDCGGFKGGYEGKTLAALANKAKQHGVNHVIVEANFGDGMFTKLLEPVMAKIHPCRIEEVKHSKQKELRIIDTLEPLMNSHRLIVDQSLVEREVAAALNGDSDDTLVYNLFYQMTRITKERGALKHDDRLDALAMACAYWVDAVAQDADRRARELEEEQQTKILEDFIEFASSPDAFTLFDPARASDSGTNRRFF